MSNIGGSDGGLLVGTFDGKTVFAVFQESNYYMIKEIFINLEEKSWTLINSY
jgi:hypothetical protein